VRHSVSGVGVLDKAVAVLDAIATAPAALADLVATTELSRATAHRLAVALEAHGLVRRDDDGRFVLGLRLLELGHRAAEAVPLWLDARPALAWLRDETGESTQLYVRDGEVRVCVESLESPHELRTIVPVGARLPLDRGSAGKVLSGASSGVSQSVGERQPGVASVSAAVHEPGGRVVAAVSVSGPIDRLGRQPARGLGSAVAEAARRIESAAGRVRT
jgi:DNA-binding IclR family transcriptional regulator